MQPKALGPTKKPKTVAHEPVIQSEAQTRLGFDFVKFNQHVESKSATSAKSPKYSKKTWRLGGPAGAGEQPPSFTRKRFGGFGQFFWKHNSSSALSNQAQPAANALAIEFGGPKLLAACQAIEQGKVKDTKTYHGHIKVLSVAQQKWQAKQPLNQAQKALDAAQESLTSQVQQLERLRQDGIAEANKRLGEMVVVRDGALAAKQALRSEAEIQEHAKAKALASSLVKQVTQSTRATESQELAPDVEPIPANTKKKRSALQKMKGRVLALSPKSDKKAATTANAPQRTSSAKPTEKKPSVTVDREALEKQIRASAEANGDTPQEYIEYLLLDNPVAAYLPTPVFGALRELHAEISRDSFRQFTQDAEAALQPQVDEVAELQRARDQALLAYDALPMPG